MPQEKDFFDQFEDAPKSNVAFFDQFEDVTPKQGERVITPKKGFISRVVDEYKNKLSDYSGLVTGEKPFIELLPKKSVNKLEPHDSRVLVGYDSLLDNIRNRTTDLAGQELPSYLAKPMAQFGSLATDAVRTGLDIATDPLNYLGFKGAAGNVGRIYGEGLPKNIGREVPLEVPRTQRALPAGKYHVSPGGEAGVPLATDIPRSSMRERLRTDDIELKPVKSEVIPPTQLSPTIAGQPLHGVTPEAAKSAEAAIKEGNEIGASRTANPITQPSASDYIKATREGTVPKGTSFADFVKGLAKDDSGTFDPILLKSNASKVLKGEPISATEELRAQKVKDLMNAQTPEEIEKLRGQIAFLDRPVNLAKRLITEEEGSLDLGKFGLKSKEERPPFGEPGSSERQRYIAWEHRNTWRTKQEKLDNLIATKGEKGIDWTKDWQGDSKVRSIQDARNEIEHFKDRELAALENIKSVVNRLITDESGTLDLGKLKGAFDSKINSRKYKTVYNKIAQTLANGGRLDADFLKSNGKLVDQILASGTLEKDIANIQKVQADQPPIQKLLSILEVNKVNRAEQDAIRSREVGKRLGAFGETFKGDQKSFAMGASKMRGEYEKVVSPVEFQLGQTDTDLLFKQIKDANVTNGEKLRAGFAVRDLLEGVRTLQPNEIDLLDRIYGNGVGNKLIKLHGGLGLTGLKLAKTANTMKSMKASLDLSAPFRQGLGLVHRKEFWRAFKEMGKYATSDSAYQAGQRAIQEHPEFLFSRESGLFTADHTPGGFEEQFMDSYLNDVHRLMGKGAKFSPFEISERSYTGFLNKLRFDTFNALIEKANKAGRQTFDIVQQADELGNIIEQRVPNDLAKQIAHYVNNATGRGSLGSLEKNARGLNNLMFSPRLIASRLTTLNPVYYVKADPFVRKEALKTLFALGSFTAIAGGVGEFLGGEVLRGLPFSQDATSADYMKSKFGNTRVDASGGFLPYVVLMSRIAQNKSTSSTTNKTNELGKGITSSAAGLVGNFAADRLSPAAALIKTLMDRENSRDFKEPYSATQEVKRAFAPLILQDIQELYEEDPDSVPIALLGGLGMGIQTYK